MKRIFFICLFAMSFMANVSGSEINISSLSIEEKIAQMIIISPSDYDSRYADIGVGGIMLTGKKTKNDYSYLIDKYQNASKIKLFVAADMEGYWNPFKDFFESENFGEVKDEDSAYELGLKHGKIMKELGFNLDFSPVVDKRNNVWPGRSFTGSDEEVKSKIRGYIQGLQNQSIMATAKHYPGVSMIKDPHLWKVEAEVYKNELELFYFAAENGVDAIMTGHPSVHGALDSKGKPVTVSYEAIKPLRQRFDGIIVTDAISMWGLRKHYLFNYNQIYIDSINAGNDVILDMPLWFSPFSFNPGKLKKRINFTANAVREGKISEKRINESVRRILEAKGYKVVE